ncbi:hypothetical protein PAXRUDRAFT_834402 [Paxillus rubicundulus Ve08.2h10]|uniref:Uncharacterized protein n=1 Tax=Paxillus rubicundulus Ve08.2h10 TaxID=930991 RepID=A0A0D0DDN5_9AGAM|nr:hypothetical protein PAXRUDRAFT_834402 [Paxillus rubicundulus Ve08.2h10]
MKSARRHPGFVVSLLYCRLYRFHSSIPPLPPRVGKPLFAFRSISDLFPSTSTYDSVRYIRKSTIIISSVASSVHVYDVDSGKLVLGPIQVSYPRLVVRRFTHPRRFSQCLEALTLNVFGAIWQLAVSRPPVSDQPSPNLSERYTSGNSAFASRSLR